jgi:transcriptional regulator with XRE-family HTH domain
MSKLTSLPAMLRAARDKGGFTNRDLADKIGRDESTVSLWMSGKRTPRMKNLEQLARVMGVEMADLWSGPEAMPATAMQVAVLEGMNHLDETQQEAVAALVRSMRSRTP